MPGRSAQSRTTLARHALPGYRYLSLEQPRTRDEAVNDPERLLGRAAKGAPGVILDEVQRAAEGPFGVLVYGGDDSGDHWDHTVRPHRVALVGGVVGSGVVP